MKKTFHATFAVATLAISSISAFAQKDPMVGGAEMYPTKTLKTVQGEDLTASMMGDKIMLTDAKGGMCTITTADVFQSNGVIHVVGTVLMPS
jgi:uncharacterized surface protein with fasciclin (FAS1) repeats